MASAVSSCQGTPITVAQIVSITGLPVLCVNRCLNALAYDCGAHLEVSSEGKITYLFPSNFDWLYRSSFFQNFLSFLWRWVEKAVSILVRLVFGSILFFSVAVIYALCFAALEIFSVFGGMESAAGNMRRDFFNILISFLKLPNKSNKSTRKTQLPPFLENCFSFLFGPADPNKGIDEYKWRTVANAIRARQGVVIPENLRVWSHTADLEKFELSVLVRLDGMPMVTDSGDILYYFPSLVTAPENDLKLPSEFSYLEERCWHFSGVDTKDLVPVIALALVNLVGCNLIYFAANSLPSIVNKPLLYLGITLLWLYGNMFLIFPLIRIALCAKRNHGIIERNITRKMIALELMDAPEELQERLLAASSLAAEIAQNSDESRTVFSTREDSLEQFIMDPSIQ